MVIRHEQYNPQAELYKVLGNAKRVAIIRLLHEDELSVDEIAKRLGISKSNISQHLMHLRYARLVKTKKEGTNVYYRVANEHIGKLSDAIDKVVRSI